MLNYVFLGIIQGIFEWIPISSEGVVALASQFLIKEMNPVDLALFLHLGTFFAVLIYFRKDWLQVLKLKDLVLLRFLIISTIVSGIIGFALYYLVRDITVGGSLLLLTGFGLLITAFFHKSKASFGIDFNKLPIIAGILQGLAVIPGLSRSGATIFGLSLGRLDPGQILKLSYMMSAPVVLGMAVFLGFKNPVLISESWLALIFSFLTGLLALNILLRIAEKINFFKFALIFSFLCFLGAGLEFLI